MSTSKALTTSEQNSLQPIINMVLDGLQSEHSRRAYEKALADFLTWYNGQGKPGLSKATVQAYSTHLKAQGFSSSTVNVRMSAIRKLAEEAEDNGLLDATIANGIARVKGASSAGVRSGNWLTKHQAEKVLSAPDTSTLKGLRDRAILAVLIGAGLRRGECASLTVAHIQQREGRWVIVDLVGKRGKIRSVPIASWVKLCIDAWTSAAGITDGFIFRGMNRHAQLITEQISDQSIADMVDEYSQQLKIKFAAHDLRRTFAKLSLKGGADLQQISLSLGHQSLVTTQRYLGDEQDFTDAPSDYLKLRIDTSDD